MIVYGDSALRTGAYNVARAYTANGLNRYSAAGGTALDYDDNGNLISETTQGVTRTYTYDIENRLVSTSTGAALSYDPLGRLYQVTLGGDTTRFLYDGDALMAEYDGTGAMTRRYVHNEGADVPLLSYAGSGLGQLSYLHADHQGSIVAISDAAGASAINTYDEYGIPGTGNSGRFQYTGQIWLPELGMYHYKARAYSPTLGRFLQTDPVGYQDQFNLYAYVGNDPVNATDPTGMAICGSCSGSTTDRPSWDRNKLSRRSWDSLAASSMAAASAQAGILDILMGDHDYATPPIIICPAVWRCTAAQVGSVYGSVRGGIPGSGGPGMIVSGQTYMVYELGVPQGHVTSYVSRDRLTVSNVTNRDHVLHYGWVNRNAMRDAAGNWVSITHGRGTNYYGGGFMAAINQANGPSIFISMDMRIRERLQEMTNGR